MESLDMTGQACPIPVITTKKLLEAAAPGTSVQVIVDNPTAVDNLAKFAAQRGYRFERSNSSDGGLAVVVTSSFAPQTTPTPTAPDRKKLVVAVSSQTMGEGDERLGATLLKGFLYALTESSQWPEAVVFYNGGAHLTVEGSESLDDLRTLADAGVTVLTCGTCLNHYGLTDKLAVGEVTNMYSIVELLAAADSVIKP